MASHCSRTPLPRLLDLMSGQHGACTRGQARACGLDAAALRRLVEIGVLVRAGTAVFVARGAPCTWRQSAMIAVLTPGCSAVSHGAAARLHGLDGFATHEPVNVMAKKGAWPDVRPPAVAHFTRGLTPDDISRIDGIPVLTVATTLALLSPIAGRRSTHLALRSAVRMGFPPRELRANAMRWRSRGRPGPSALIEMLDEIERQA